MKTTIKNVSLALFVIGALTTTAQKVAHISMDSLVMLMPETKTMKDVATAYMKDRKHSRIPDESLAQFCREHSDLIPFGSLTVEAQNWVRSLGYQRPVDKAACG